MPNRRGLLVAGAGAVAATPALAQASGGLDLGSMRGALDAAEFGVRPRGDDDQSAAFSRMLEGAGTRGMPVFLPPGTYSVGNLDLPRSVRLVGVPGASRILYRGEGRLFLAENLDRFELSNLVLDGGAHWLHDDARALIDLRDVAVVAIDNCEVLASGKNGLSLEACAGRVERTTIAGAAECGLYAIDSAGLSIAANHVRDCGDGGILVHRWQPGEDNTLVSGNRVERIAARSGGTGQNGNGINVYQANNVVVASNHVSDCAFSAIRSNGGGNVQITGNTCLRSGETALYSEFVFEGALISGNIVDGASIGISIANFNEGGRLAVCSGNLVRNLRASGPYEPDPPGFGIGISVEADTTVTGNTVEGAPAFGINLGWGPYLRDVVVSGNVVRQAGYGIGVSVVEGGGSAIVSGNVITGALKGGIVGHRWADIVTGDMGVEPDARFANLSVERNRVG